MALEVTRPLRAVTFVMAAIIYLAVEVASDPDGWPSSFGLVFGGLLAVIAVVASRWLPAPVGRKRPPYWATALLIAFLVAPLALEPLLRRYFDIGLPLELRFVHALRALGIGLAAFAAWPACLRLTGVVGLFNMLFVSAMGDQRPIPYLLAAYAVVGSIWLILTHAARRQTAAAADAVAVVARVALRFPVRHFVVVGALAVAALSLLVVGPSRVVATLGELMPTSGGTGDYDPFARGGVNDGDEETTGSDPRGTGFVESDQFLDSPDPALYDVVSDLFGEPRKRQSDVERMMAMGKGDVREHAGKTPDNKRPSRHFETSRKSPTNPRRPDDRAARALFEVQGRTPLHLRVEAYATYAEGVWETARRRPSVQRIENESGDPWMRIAGREPLPRYGPIEAHRLKFASLKGALLPTGALLERFRVGKLDRADYFAWEFDGVLRMEGRKSVPPGAILDAECRTAAPEGLAEDDFAVGATWPPAEYRFAPDAFDSLARSWVEGRPRGWPQIEKILDRLRGEYELDRAATVPEHVADPAAHFLTESRRGPDYLFASAATLLLRRLGYPTRMVLGYYVAPEDYDPQTQHTPVVRDDLHFWCEVLLRDGRWLVVEPSPGYAVLRPARRWYERLGDAVKGVASWGARHPIICIVGMLLGMIAVWRRRQGIDALLVLRWRVAPGRTWQEVVFGCLRLIERRGRWARLARSDAQTLAAWTDTWPGRRDREWNDFVRLGEWAAYGSGLPSPWPSPEVHRLCRRVLQTWTARRLSEPAGGAA